MPPQGSIDVFGAFAGQGGQALRTAGQMLRLGVFPQGMRQPSGQGFRVDGSFVGVPATQQYQKTEQKSFQFEPPLPISCQVIGGAAQFDALLGRESDSQWQGPVAPWPVGWVREVTLLQFHQFPRREGNIDVDESAGRLTEEAVFILRTDQEHVAGGEILRDAVDTMSALPGLDKEHFREIVPVCADGLSPAEVLGAADVEPVFPTENVAKLYRLESHKISSEYNNKSFLCKIDR
jgi:hypothetical protein